MFSKSHHFAITGGAGFIGSHLAKELVRLGQQVTVIDNLCGADGSNLKEIEGKIQFVQADVCQFPVLKSAFEGIDFVFHLAAQISVARSVQCPEETWQNNVQGTENVLEAALQAGVKKVVFASSSSVYGNGTDVPYMENAALEFKSPYALSKYMGEKLCRHYTEVFGLHTIILRGFNVFGPGQRTDGPYAAVVAKFIQTAKEDKPFPIHGDGSQVRDFIYVEDVVKANLLAVQQGGAGEAYNVASGQPCSVQELCQLIEQIAGRSLGCVFLPERAGDVAISSANINKMKSLGFVPAVSLKEGLKRTWQAY